MMTKSIFLVAALLLGATGLHAEKHDWSKASANGYEYRYVENDPMQARYYTLKNGLTVILSVNKEEPRLQTIIATKAGSKTDPHDHTGLAHYLEHMLFKGTDQYGSLDWTKEKPLLDQIDGLYETYNSTRDEGKRKEIYHRIDSVSGLAAHWAIANEYDKMMGMIGAKGTNAFTDFERTAYINSIPSNQIGRWLMVEAERFRNPVLRIFHTELEAVYEEKNRTLDNDDEKVTELLFDKLFQKHNYGQQTTIGTIEHLKNPSLKAIREYFHKNYVPNNMCVIMAGDLNPDSVIKQVDKAFAYMQPQAVAPYTFEPETDIKQPIEASVYGPDAAYVTMGFRFPGANSREARLLNFMSNVLSNGNAGLMDLNLVKKQEVLEASAGAYCLKDYSVLFLQGKAKEGQSLETVKQKMLDQIELLKQGKFDEEMLQAIINNYKKSLMQQRESNGGRAFGLLDAFTTDVSWDRVVSDIEWMNQLSRTDIIDFANKWLNKNYVCIYKRTGKDDKVLKVDKPAITPVEVNREAQSDFLKTVAATPAKPIEPVFAQYDKDIQKGTLSTSTLQLPVWTVANKTNSLFTQYYYLKSGSLHNPLLPIAMEYLQYLGTDKYTADDISKKFYALACDFDVHAEDEESYVSLKGLQENYAKALDLFEHLLGHCQADESALKDMIAGMKKRRSDEKLNKDVIRYGLISYARYGARNPFNNKLSNEQLDQIKATELIDILHHLTAMPHQVLYYGPATMADLQTSLKKAHALPDHFQKPPAIQPYTFRKVDKNEVLFTDYDMVQAEIQWFRNNETYDPARVPLVRTFNEYFGGNMSGIVFQDIRESKALAYSTYAAYGTPGKKSDPFYLTAYIGCQADKLKESLKAMQDLLTQLPQSQKLFDHSLASMRNSISTTRITKTNLLFSALNAEKLGLTYDMNEKVYRSLDHTRLEDIEHFYEQEIASKPCVLTVLASEQKVDQSLLKQFGPVTKLSLRDIFGY